MNNIEDNINNNIFYHITNLIQQFYIIGINNNNYINLDFYKNINNIKFSPTIISKFPNINLPYMNIDDNIIISHCFPKGFQILEENNNTNNEYFFFWLENPSYINFNNNDCLNNIIRNNIKTDKIYFTCLLFYEKLSDYYENIFKEKNKNEDYKLFTEKFIAKIICFSSFLPFYGKFMSLLNYILKNTLNKNDVNQPIEKLIEKIIFNISYPTRDITKYEIKFDKKKIVFEQNVPNSLPSIEINLQSLFQYFKKENIFLLIKYILFEIPIIFFHKKKIELCNIIESLITIIFPFEYVHNVIHILPIENYSLIQKMNKFIIGINENFDKKIFDEKHINLGSKNVIIVSLIYDEINKTYDSKILLYNKIKEINIKDLNNIENNNILFNNLYEKTNLPEHYKTKTLRDIKEYLYELEKKKNKTIDEFTKIIREKIFLYFFYATFLNYKNSIKLINEISVEDYKNYLNKNININDLFNTKKFFMESKYINDNNKNFYLNFFNTDIFYDFIGKKIFNDKNNIFIENLFFDEKIEKKLNGYLINKKKPTPFLDFKFMTKKIEIEIKTKNFKQNQIQFLLEKDNYYLFFYSQKFYFIENNNNNKNFRIKYVGFPKLIEDKKIYDNKINYNNNSKYLLFYDDFMSKNFIINNNFFDIKNNNYKIKLDMNDYIYLLWLKTFSFSLYYIRNIEDKKILYKYMFLIINKYKFIDKDLYKMLFNSLIENAELNIIYEFFKNCKVLNQNYIFYLILREKFIKEKNKKNLNNNNNKNNFNIKKDEIIFKTIKKCHKCKNIINISPNNFNIFNVNYDNEQVLIGCSFCKQLNLVNIKFIIKNYKNELYENSFKLLTPYYLYYNIINNIIINNKIDINNLYKNHSFLFLNLIWYFNKEKLPFDFLISYNIFDCKNYICETQNNNNNNNFNNNSNIYFDDDSLLISNNKKFFNKDIIINNDEDYIHSLSKQSKISKLFDNNKNNINQLNDYNNLNNNNKFFYSSKPFHLTNNNNDNNNNNNNNDNNNNNISNSSTKKKEKIIDIKELNDINLANSLIFSYEENLNNSKINNINNNSSEQNNNNNNILYK